MPDTTPHIPTEETRELVRGMVAVGIRREDVARYLDIDPKTLRKYYKEEMSKAAVEANTKIGKTLYKKALDGDTTSLIWWTKAQMGWSERVKFAGDEEEPIAFKDVTDVKQKLLKAISEDQLNAILTGNNDS